MDLGAPVVLYDGHCGFCRRWSRRLARWDGQGRIRQVPYQKREGIAGLPVIADADLDRALHVVLPGGRVACGAHGIIALLPWLPGGRPLGWLASIPGMASLADRLYQVVARRRHRLAPAGATCEVR
jgi:predicted DCC family thiol-disulfide oxidoreductase YuxK